MKKNIIIFLILLTLPCHVSAQQKIPILIYHSIDEYKGVGSKELYVTSQNFEQQMTYLKNHDFTLLTFEKWQERNKVKKPIFITFDDGYKNNWTAYSILQKLKTETFHPSATFFVISNFIGRANRFSKEELIELANSGVISIQSHTATHPDLTKEAHITDELKNSKNKLEKITGKEVITLAYPYGAFNKKVLEETKKYYSFGLTTTPEYYQKKGGSYEQYLLPRLYIKYSTTLDEFVKIVEGEIQ